MGIALDADGRADESGLVAPGTAADDGDAWKVEFPMYRKAQRFCSKACHVKWHNHAYSQLIREAKAIVARHKGTPRADQATRELEQQQLANVEAKADFGSLEKTS